MMLNLCGLSYAVHCLEEDSSDKRGWVDVIMHAALTLEHSNSDATIVA